MINKMQKALNTTSLGRSCFYFSSIDSTSTYIKKMWKHLPHGHTVIAAEQSAGRGRTGKTFYSPKNDGLYFSFILKEEKYLNDPLFTVKMSYAVCTAIDMLTQTETVKIKWINDIYIEKKKLSGILCEAVRQDNSRGIIVGIGVNFYVNKSELPSELKNKIGSLKDVVKRELDKMTLCGYILNKVEELYSGDEIPNASFLELYRRRSAVLGKEITVLKDGGFLRAAALEIADDGGLVVRYVNGITEKLVAGEISIAI